MERVVEREAGLNCGMRLVGAAKSREGHGQVKKSEAENFGRPRSPRRHQAAPARNCRCGAWRGQWSSARLPGAAQALKLADEPRLGGVAAIGHEPQRIGLLAELGNLKSLAFASSIRRRSSAAAIIARLAEARSSANLPRACSASATVLFTFEEGPPRPNSFSMNPVSAPLGPSVGRRGLNPLPGQFQPSPVSPASKMVPINR